MVGCMDQKVGSRGELDWDDSPMPTCPLQYWIARILFSSSVNGPKSYPSANIS